MIRSICFELGIWKSRIKRDKLYNSVSKKFNWDKKKDPSLDRQEYFAMSQYDYQAIDEAIDGKISRYWQDVADRWNIPVPLQTDKEHWDRNVFNKWVLTRHGVSAIRKVYFELKMNTQSMLIPWLTFWIALVGAAGTLWQVFHRAVK